MHRRQRRLPPREFSGRAFQLSIFDKKKEKEKKKSREEGKHIRPINSETNLKNENDVEEQRNWRCRHTNNMNINFARINFARVFF